MDALTRSPAKAGVQNHGRRLLWLWAPLSRGNLSRWESDGQHRLVRSARRRAAAALRADRAGRVAQCRRQPGDRHDHAQRRARSRRLSIFQLDGRRLPGRRDHGRRQFGAARRSARLAQGDHACRYRLHCRLRDRCERTGHGSVRRGTDHPGAGQRLDLGLRDGGGRDAVSRAAPRARLRLQRGRVGNCDRAGAAARRAVRAGRRLARGILVLRRTVARLHIGGAAASIRRGARKTCAGHTVAAARRAGRGDRRDRGRRP